MAEVTVYTVLAAGVASAVFVAGGRPLWHVGLVLAGAAAVVGILAVVARGSGRPTPVEPTEARVEMEADRPPPLPDGRARHDHR